MKRVTWEIGVQKPAGNVICDAILHYNEPKFVQFGNPGGTNMEQAVNYTYSPDFDGTNYSDIYGYLDFSLVGGLSNGMKITLIW